MRNTGDIVVKILLSIALTVLILGGLCLGIFGLCQPNFPMIAHIFFGLFIVAMIIVLPLAILFVWRG